MKNELISVIVPVYNVEKYVEHCVKTILEQTYKNIEIILVDDGSTDNSSTICDNLAKKDKRIKVFHKKNGGLSDARNYGIKKSSGKYLSFIDSDDYINKHMIESLYNELVKQDADMALCDFRITNNQDEDTGTELNGDVIVLDRIQGFYNLYTPYATRLIGACIKLYKREIYDKIEFPVGKIMEDLAITHYIINSVNKIVIMNNKYYYYYQRTNSITHSFNEKYLESLDYLEDRKKIFKKLKDETLLEYTDYYICLKACILYNDAKRYKEYKEIARDLKKKVKSLSKQILKNKHNTLFQKIICLAFLINPSLYRIMEFINLKIINRK